MEVQEASKRFDGSEILILFLRIVVLKHCNLKAYKHSNKNISCTLLHINESSCMSRAKKSYTKIYINKKLLRNKTLISL